MGWSTPAGVARAELVALGAAQAKKPDPKPLQWLSWEALPPVRWAGSAELVETQVLRAVILKAVRSKSAEPDGLLRQFSALFDLHDRQDLALFLVRQWIAADLRPWSSAPEQEHLRSYHALDDPIGQELASKGVLAVAAACGGLDVVGLAHTYVVDYYGKRLAQSVALLTMLAWVDHPEAVQVLLKISKGFRTRTLQDVAGRQVVALATRRGWTADELADRSVPTAGFEGGRVIELSFGPRVFSARLQDDLSVQLRDPAGAVIKALPAPRVADDAVVAAQAKKAFAAARKQVKAVVKQQSDRLYEAMCVERSWSIELWREVMAGHPILGVAVQRLAWVVLQPAGAEPAGAEPVSFRPMPDGTFTDADDNQVTVPDQSRIGIAHDVNLPGQAVSRWLEHFADYEVAPLFQQFGKPLVRLTAEQAQLTKYLACEGHVIESNVLRRQATKLGYAPGHREYHDLFEDYVKRFPGLGIQSQLATTGTRLTAGNHSLAFTALTFQEIDTEPGEGLPLGEVPAVLFSETANDLHALAKLGTGYDPDWQKLRHSW